MSKNIIFCADGTWNNSGTEAENKVEALSNVYKLFNHLSGVATTPVELKVKTGQILEYEKSYVETGQLKQIAKYINGVGNSAFKLNRAMGGALGFGLIERIARGYTFISRNYQPGDSIYIVGFSRGAYTARALAGLIAAKGVLATKFQQGDAASYDMAQRAWYSYRSGITYDKYTHRLQNLLTAFTSLKNYILSATIQEGDFIKGVPVKVVGVWDTVGSLGIPDFEFGDKRAEVKDAFSFADLDLSPKVQFGLHAIALDEARMLFTPTLWNARSGIQQAIFPGAHSDVGGGYAEHGLSDGALQWMIQQLQHYGALFKEDILDIAPNAVATAHKPWKSLLKLGNGLGKRVFYKKENVIAHDSLLKRIGKLVQHDVGEAETLYAPSNWPPT
jgi:uncharacterized protein (DUF2235 family)